MEKLRSEAKRENEDYFQKVHEWVEGKRRAREGLIEEGTRDLKRGLEDLRFQISEAMLRIRKCLRSGLGG